MAVLLAVLRLAVLAGAATNRVVSTAPQFDAAVSASQPGDTITLTNKVWQDADLLFKRNGTAAAPITLRPAAPGAVILSGKSRLRIAGNWLVVDGLRFQNGFYTNSDVIQFRENSSTLATNCCLRNTAIVDYNPPDAAVNNKWVSLYGLSNRIENCYLKGKTNLGTTLVVWLGAGQTNVANHHVVRGNHFGPRPALNENGDETLRVGDSSTSFITSRTRVEDNYFRGCNGDIEIISSKSCENLYRYNTFDGCEGALTLRHGNRCTVEGNFFFGRNLPNTGGVRVIGNDHRVVNNYLAELRGTGGRSALTLSMGLTNSPLNGYFQVRNATVAFNTFVNCKSPILIGNPADYDGTNVNQPPKDCLIGNNIVRGTNAPLVDQRTAPADLRWEGNVMFGASLGIPATGGIRFADPLLNLGDDGLWRPATNSPVLASAVGSYPFATDDFEGQVRADPKDVGCDQVVSGVPRRGPLGAGDVGPNWMRHAGPIRSVAWSSNSVGITWESLPALVYRVQYSSNLLNWYNAGPPLSNWAVTITWTDDGSATGGAPSGAARRYYRIALLP